MYITPTPNLCRQFKDSPHKAEWKALLEKVQTALDALGMAPQKPCAHNVSYANDGGAYCTFGEGTGRYASLLPADDNGYPIDWLPDQGSTIENASIPQDKIPTDIARTPDRVSEM